MKTKTQHPSLAKRIASFSLIFFIFFLLTCTKDNNNGGTPPDNNNDSTQGYGAILTPQSIYDTLTKVTAPTSGGSNLSSYFLTIPDVPFFQGGQGSCASCATAMAKSIMDNMQYGISYTNNGIIYSPSFLYNVCKDPGNCTAGSSIEENLKRLRSVGDCSIKEMPYSESDCFTQPTTSQITLAASNKILDYMPVSLDAPSIKYAIEQGNPVIVAFNATLPYWKNTFPFYFNSNNDTWESAGSPGSTNHATILYGWDDDHNAFKMLNQWGSSFGDNGSIWVDYSLISNRNVFFQAWEIINQKIQEKKLEFSGDLNFDDVEINTTETKTLTLSNNGSSAINVSNVSINGPYSIDKTNFTVAANGNTPLKVSFTPTTTGEADQTLTITSDASNSPTTIAATGNGIQQQTQTKIISLSGSLSFGNVDVSKTSSKTLTISNTGNTALNVTSISYNNSVFSGDWNGSIPAGGSQPVTITFAPLAAQTYSGTLTVNCDKTSGTNTASLDGTGTQTQQQTKIISLSGNLNFGDVVVGQTATSTLTISNTGNASLAINSISVPNGYTLGSYSSPISSGGSENVTVYFSPTSVQSYNGNIVVSSDATSGTNTINASGNGISSGGGVTVVPPLGTYGNCAPIGSYNCPPLFGLGIINAKFVSINTSTNQIVVEIKKCDGTQFNAGGNLNVVNLLCGGVGAVSYGFGAFQAGSTTFQMTITDNNMVGSKAYVAFITQTVGSFTYNYSAQTIVVTY
ncbi:hypothetical protein BH10BAC2_BH10BAC2_46580 [soil metagenome]